MITLLSIYKKAGKQNFGNYRRITVSPTLNELHRKLLQDIIKEEYKANKSKGQSMTDNAWQYLLTQTNNRKESVSESVDLSRVYDNILIIKLWKYFKVQT